MLIGAKCIAMPLPSDYREHSPDSVLPHGIEAEWQFTASSDGVHRVLPDGRMDLIVVFRREGAEAVHDVRWMIVGPAQRWADVPVSVDDHFLGVRFCPGWGGLCLGVDASSLCDTALFDDEVFAALGDDMRPIRGALTVDTLSMVLRDLVRKRAMSVRHAYGPLGRAIDMIQLGGGRLGLHDLAIAVGAPERTLRRHLADAVGLSFKALSSVIRFQRTMRLLEHGSLSLADAALEGGYSDQAHMTREFRRHGGFTPGMRPPLVLIGMSFD